MGTSFVTISRDVTPREARGFWMRDEMLELWLRLLALHLPEPCNDKERDLTLVIRNRWLLASKGWFIGCVPHHLKDACATSEGMAVVRKAVESLLAALRGAETPLDAGTLELLGNEHPYHGPTERVWLVDIGNAFLDLLDGKIAGTAHSTEVMPGSKPYKREKPGQG